ncbi:hypothetical protein Anapl_15034 [Anas platyrhynchos]|uniref:Uncharacterized protein n=1 Tax=Anas platyrhynchos TaxID=8839 RepID=R0L4D6_ANAPL|nr:hypothetical protein Anapl_15034 [Anas platyrhynchos]
MKGEEETAANWGLSSCVQAVETFIVDEIGKTYELLIMACKLSEELQKSSMFAHFLMLLGTSVYEISKILKSTS